MCLTALSIASGIGSFIGESEAARAQNQLYVDNAYQAQMTGMNKASELQMQGREKQVQAADRAREAQINALQSIGTANASTQNYGGNSTNLTVMDLARQAANQMNEIQREREIESINTNNALQANADEVTGRINSVSKSNFNPLLSAAVNGIGVGLKIAENKGKKPWTDPLGNTGTQTAIDTGYKSDWDIGYKDPLTISGKANKAQQHTQRNLGVSNWGTYKRYWG